MIEKIIASLALTLSGGSFKVMFQVYLLIFLERQGIYPKEIFAISGGVPNALAYILKKAWKLPDLWREVEPKKLFSVDWVGLFLIPLLSGKAPIFGGEGVFKSGLLESLIKREVDFRLILESPIMLWVGVMDLAEGRLRWVSNKDAGMTPELFEEYVIASMRIPVFFRPYRQKVDMGLVSNIGINEAIERGFGNILALNAVATKLEPISGVESWPESNLRHDDINHSEEISDDVKFTELINQDVLAMRALRDFWWIRIGCFFSKKLCLALGRFYFPNKRYINLCIISPPSNLQIFRKWITSYTMFRYVPKQRKVTYGYPSFNAREELLNAGKKAAEEELRPFIDKIIRS